MSKTTLFPTIPIIFEDQDILLINKPPGLVVNRAETIQEPTLQDWMAERLGETPAFPADWAEMVPADFDPAYGTPEEIFQERLGIVHRLDKDTSGVMVLAKHPGSLVALLSDFKRRRVKKQYLALVHGKVQAPEATLSFPLGRASRDRKLFAVRPDGREAVTTYRVKQRFTSLDPEHLAQKDKRFSIYQGFSLLECWPQTGRTHQIRVHLAHIRHPLVGDTTYVGQKRSRLDPLWCPRQFLHAEKISLTHPRSQEIQEFSAPLWPDLKQVLEFLITD
jgi:23S rRNA pseudouridine1911/1915/1917 synthase